MKNRTLRQRLGFAFAGIRAAWNGESSFRQQCIAAGGVLALLVWLRPAPLWWAIILLTIGAVLAAELLNTALERTVDHLHPASHPAIKIAKDCAAGAVLVLSAIAVAVFAAFLIQYWIA
ncbi:MAG: diacylglycerol kinase [Rhodospirillales bacterium]|nr:diacylglycerol kinase [Rhodospirillales bacterium]